MHVSPVPFVLFSLGVLLQHDTYVSPTLTYDHRENPRDIWSYAWAGRRVLQKQYMGAGAPEGDITQHEVYSDIPLREMPPFCVA